jgi:hypothetical protein
MMRWLGTVPTTNAIIVSGIGLAWVTCIAALVGWKIPEGWLTFVAAHMGISVAQFLSKRLTHRDTTGSPAPREAHGPD